MGGETQRSEEKWHTSATAKGHTVTASHAERESLLNSFLKNDFFSKAALLSGADMVYHGDHCRNGNCNNAYLGVYLGQNMNEDWSKLRPLQFLMEVTVKPSPPNCSTENVIYF